MVTINYNTDIPDGPHSPSADQPLMKQNTNAIDTLLAVDHYSFNLSNGGYHKHVHLINEAAPGLNGADGVIYSINRNNAPFGTNSWLAWQNALGSTIIIGDPAVAIPNDGQTSLVGGLLMKWGIVTPLVNNTLTSVNFFPAFLNNCFFVIATLIPIASTSSDSTISTLVVDRSSFKYNFAASSAYNGFYWMAVGN